jgi:hypothetical protein
MYSMSNGGSLRMRRIEREPVLEVVAHANRAHPTVGDAVAQPQVGLFRVPQLPTALLRRQQHGERGVLDGLDLVDGIHDDQHARRVGLRGSRGHSFSPIQRRTSHGRVTVKTASRESM